jgi:hypothetical protein
MTPIEDTLNPASWGYLGIDNRAYYALNAISGKGNITQHNVSSISYVFPIMTHPDTDALRTLYFFSLNAYHLIHRCWH